MNKPDTKFRACKMACGVTVWGVRPVVCEACRQTISNATGNVGMKHDTPEVKAEKQRRIALYGLLASARLPLVYEGVSRVHVA